MKNLRNVLYLIICISVLLKISPTNVFGNIPLEKSMTVVNFSNNENVNHLKIHHQKVIKLKPDQIKRQKLNNIKTLLKTAAEGVVLDSVIYYDNWGLKYKSTFIYSSSGKMLVWLVEVMNPDTGLWQNYTKSSYTYDANGNKLTYQFIYWTTQTGTGQWLNYERDTYTYDSNGNELTSLNEHWDSDSGQWVNIERTTTTYNDNGKTLTFLEEEWDSTAGKWINSSFETNTYDDIGNWLVYSRQLWDEISGQWINYDKATSTFDVNNNEVQLVWELWNSDTKKWENDWRMESDFDDRGNELTKIWKRWDSTTRLWNFHTRYTYTYDAGNNRLTYLEEKWEVVSKSGQWQNYGKATYTYDSNGNLLTSLEDQWLAASAQWANFLRKNQTYNNDSHLTQAKSDVKWSWSDVWEPFSINFDLSDSFNELVIESCDINVYYRIFTKIDNENTIDLNKFILYQNYPNPFNPVTSIDFDLPASEHVSLKIYDTNGRLVKILANQQMQTGSHTISWDSYNESGVQLPSGIYFCRIEAGEYTNTLKMTLLK